MNRTTRTSLRAGFSLMELLVVLIVGAIVSTMALPAVGRMMAETRLQRAASVVASDLQLAHSMAARRRLPMQVLIDAPNKVISIRSYPTTTTVYQRRYFDKNSEYPVATMVASTNSLVMYPSGLSTSTIEIGLLAGGKTRRVRMSRAGQIRIEK